MSVRYLRYKEHAGSHEGFIEHESRPIRNARVCSIPPESFMGFPRTRQLTLVLPLLGLPCGGSLVAGKPTICKPGTCCA